MSLPEIVVTLFTPFAADGSVDDPALERCVRYYREAGAAGLFANCQTSETLKLDPEERLRIVERIAGMDSGLTLYSGVNTGPDIAAQAAELEAVRKAGADVPVAWVSTLPSPKDLGGQLLEIAARVDGPLGIYECPDPEHRLLEDGELERVARSGRFVFFKDTCRDDTVFARRMERISGTVLRSYQANWNCLPASLDAGAAGFSGWLAAARPDAVVRYVEGALPQTEKRTLHAALFELQEAMKAARYPASGKHLLHRRGLAIEANQRDGNGTTVPVDEAGLGRLRAADEAVDTILRQTATGSV